MNKKSALNIVASAIEYEKDYIGNDGPKDYLLALKGLKKKIRAASNVTVAEAKQWYWECYNATVGLGGYGDCDSVDGMFENLREALELDPEEFWEAVNQPA